MARSWTQRAASAESPGSIGRLWQIRLIAMKELRWHLLTEKFLWTTFLCLGMVLMSFWLMAHDYQARLINYSVSLQKDDDLYGAELGQGNTLYCYFLKQGHQTSRSVYIRPTSIVKEPNVMSIFAQGLERRMSRPIHYSIFKELEIDDVPYTNFLLDNIYSKPDLMYIVQIAMSLLALLFVFQSICGERERGTLKLMLSNSVPRYVILLGKWLGGYLALILPFLLAVGIGLLALNLSPSIRLDSEHWIRLAWILIASLLYISVFFTLGILISALTRRTVTAFFAALFAWVIIVLVLPNTATLVAHQLKPMESAQYLQIQKELTKQLMENEQEKVKHSSYWVPAYGHIHMDIYDKIQDTMWRLEEEYRQQAMELGDYTRVLARLSPAAAYAYAVMDIAGTNIHDELDYYQQLHRYIAEEYPLKGHQYMRFILFTHQKWDFHYIPGIWQDGLSRALTELLVLMILNVMFFLCAYLAFIRYRVT